MLLPLGHTHTALHRAVSLVRDHCINTATTAGQGTSHILYSCLQVARSSPVVPRSQRAPFEAGGIHKWFPLAFFIHDASEANPLPGYTYRADGQFRASLGSTGAGVLQSQYPVSLQCIGCR